MSQKPKTKPKNPAINEPYCVCLGKVSTPMGIADCMAKVSGSDVRLVITRTDGSKETIRSMMLIDVAGNGGYGEVAQAAYFQLLDKHDWFYQFDKDRNAYRSSSLFEQTLRTLSQITPVHMQMWSTWTRWRASPGNIKRPTKTQFGLKGG